MPDDSRIAASYALEFVAKNLGEEFVEVIGQVMRIYAIDQIALKLEELDNDQAFDWMKSGHDYALAVRKLIC